MLLLFYHFTSDDFVIVIFATIFRPVCIFPVPDVADVPVLSPSLQPELVGLKYFRLLFPSPLFCSCYLYRRLHEERVPAQGLAGGRFPGAPRGHGAHVHPVLRGAETLRRLLQRRGHGVCAHREPQRHAAGEASTRVLLWGCCCVFS